jgi:secretion/DNA translocation related TadE-like protein
VTRERGSVSVVLAAGVLVVLVLTMGVADVGRVLIARSRARTAADAAALAAADELALPTGLDPATLAAEYAARNGAILTACRCDVGTFEADVAVTVHVDGFLLFPGARDAVARARAVVDLPAG